MRKLEGLARAAVQRYHMIEKGDRIAVGVSGGKDSLVLLCVMAALSRYYPEPFTLHAVTLDMRFGNTDGDFSAIADLCRSLAVPYTIKRTELASVIFDIRKESNPCSLCARMRRGILHDTAKELGCNKLALGHHQDDAAETFLMNLMSGGTIACFSPVTYLSRKDLTMIRPLIYCPEQAVAAAAQRKGLPVIKSRCPQDPIGNRNKIKELLKTLGKDYPALTEKILSALQKGQISGW